MDCDCDLPAQIETNHSFMFNFVLIMMACFGVCPHPWYQRQDTSVARTTCLTLVTLEEFFFRGPRGRMGDPGTGYCPALRGARGKETLCLSQHSEVREEPMRSSQRSPSCAARPAHVEVLESGLDVAWYERVCRAYLACVVDTSMQDKGTR